MKIRNKKLLTKSIAMAIFMSSTLYTMPITHAAFNNNTLPSGGSVVAGQVVINDPDKANIINQTSSNAVIQWKDFSIGANATVNFSKTDGGSFNTLNYVNSGNLSQIYGTINATNGNIYIVNPAGVQIGNSAQINVGSLYVSNKNLNEKNLNQFNGNNFSSLIDTSKTSNAELMSLGNINAANKVTFDGNRIVLDVDRVKNGQDQLGVGNITIKTTQTDFDNKNVVLGYTAYDSVNKTYKGKNDNTSLAKLEGISGKTELTKNDGFMWVKDGEQLQAMDSNLSGNYAFRNSIDLNATADNNVTFNSVGDSKNAFTGNLDGLGYEVYGLHINEPGEDTGLFAKTDGATIRNFNLISGSIISDENNAGAVVGNATNTVIENVKNTINVTGTNNVGGIIGTGTNVTLNGVVNAGAIKGNSNVGGLAGSLTAGSTLKGESYNLGDIKGLDDETNPSAIKYSSNIGGLVGLANNSTIGNETGFQMYNHLDVTGGYNVGGIVGNLEDGSTVQNVYNDGTVNATGMTTEDYTFHTANKTNPNDEDDLEWSDGISKTVKDVAVANVGGIVGNSTNGTINDATNKADVQSNETTKNGDTYYIAGNVGGIVGKAMDTNMKNVTNEESNICGAHNVGGIAGYFGNTDNIASDIKYTIENAINNGGDIMGTSARDINGDVITEIVRPLGGSREIFNVGNIGGIVGYMDGDNVYVTASGNRGTVHSKEIAEANKEKPLNSNTAANVGGIVGKIDRSSNANLNTIEENVENAAVSNSYNSADVLGYTGVGGIAGMMYNGSIAGSYNTGYLRTTRLVAESGGIASLNMGGIVGDTTENTNSSSVLYDVYNKGQIGDDTYTYYGRHIGGVVGRLSGTVEKAYNNGAIYNGYNVVGGIVGWLSAGNVNNVFNTGNITVINQNTATSQVGGIVGAVGNAHGAVTISNAYNLGALRTFKNINIGTVGNNSIGGILGEVSDGTGGINNEVTIKDVYTTGNIYAGNIAGIEGTATEDTDAQIGKIFGHSVKTHNGTSYDSVVNVSNAYYIEPASGNGFNEIENNTHEQRNRNVKITDVKYDNRMNFDYTFSNENDWRIYEGNTTPILNAFMPNSSSYLDSNKNNWNTLGITDVQYGTAYDPLMTFITANKDLSLNFSDLGITNSAGLVVKDYGLTLNDFTTANGAGGYFGGLIYADGALVLNGKTNEDIKLAGTSKLYGSSVDINSSGDLTINGLVQATANDKIINDKNSGNINLTANNINVYGTLKTARTDETVTIEGLNSTRGTNIVQGTISDPNKDLTAIESLYAYNVTSKNNGDLTIKSNKDENNQYKGDVNLYYGNLGKGLIDVAGDVNLEGKNIYVDSDMVIDGNLNATADSTGEIIVDISNIGKVTNNSNIVNEMHTFLDSFKKGTGKSINFAGTDDAKITIDMWDNNTFDLDKYDLDINTLSSKLDALNVTGNNNETGKDFVYIWVADGEQLKGIQKYATDNSNSNILSYNFALKNDINATDVSDYQAIGSGDRAFTGKFDGRGNRIIGLNVENKDNSQTDNVGVFGVNAGTIKNLKVYSSTFKGYDNVGAIAGTNNGTIDNVTTLGNTVEALGSANSVVLDSKNVGAAGGVVGTNTGTVNNATSRDSVIAGEDTPSTTILTTAGGIVGINNGLVSNSQSHSAVTASEDSTYSLGGIVGVNTAKDSDSTDNKITAGLDNVNAYGVTSGIYSETGNQAYATSSNIGGIAGINKGTLHDAYNESIVKGYDNVGGIAGTNSGEISLIVNGASVTAKGNYTGGLVGSTIGNISDGRNNGVITGNDYVGGLVGSNGSGVTLKDLTNDSSAEINGKDYVGGIAGRNDGIITAKDQTNLINRGSITGKNYVGGVVGQNFGAIDNINNSITLNVSSNDGKYFGGVAGINEEKATINNATNTGDITAEGAVYVGGVVGYNKGTLNGLNGNYGNVKGKDQVGGVVGQNDTAIKNVNAYNEGSVTATDGGAGGIFATYNGDILDSTLTNKGDVKGTNIGGTGGIATVNSGDISNSTLINEGNVTNETSDYVGGIFGQKTDTNTTITGSTLSNKGEVKGKDYVGGIFGSNESTISKSTMTNEVGGNVTGTNYVGGLIGINSGNIAGGRGDYKDQKNTYYKYQIYNNGTITATGNGSNIGGLIGKNTGSLTAGYNTGNIVAGNSTNVGGIVGTNEGTVDQVFNTIMTVTGESTNTIKGKDNVGAIIGNNTSGTLTNAYSTNGGVSVLVGTGNSNTNDDNNTSIWKTYTKDGNKYKVLKVFLTSVKYDPSKKPNFVYNGKDQSVNIDEAIKNGMLTDLSGKGFGAHKDAGLMGSNSHKDAGTYTDWLYSGQIASSGTGDTFNPNNLGYDIDLATGIKDEDKIKIDKAKLTITGNYLDRIYGNTTIQNGGYGITIDGWVNGEDFSGLIGLDKSSIKDGALTGNTTGKVTNNVGDYNWTGNIIGSLKNYEFDTTVIGDSKVNKAGLVIDLNKVYHTYGKPNLNDYGVRVEGLTNGDKANIGVTMTNDTALKDNNTHTNNASENYTWTGNVSGIEGLKNNYNITVNDGESVVNKADLTIDLNDVKHTYGSPNLNDYGVSSVTGLTNGDEASKDKLDVEMTKDTALKDNNTHTNNAGENYTWTGNVSGIEGLENNYNITVNEGQSVVNKADLTIDLNENVHHEYGKPNLDDYVITGTEGLTNGDEAFEDKLDVEMTKDTALKDNNTHTNNAGENYTWTGNVSGLEGLENNYNITINPGKSTVDKGHLTITVDDSNTTVGDNPNYGGTVDGWANGDNPNDFDINFGLDDDSIIGQPGKHDGVIGVIIDGTFYPSGTEDDVFNNYDVTINAGDLTVLKPFDINDNKNWSHLYKDAPWDRNRDFKERKAEFNFVDGAIPLDEAVEEV